jgi:hypothetical protein
MPSSAEELIHSAYAYVRGVEKNKALAALTLDHLLNEHIIAIEGGDPDYVMSIQGEASAMRLPKLKRIELVQKSIDDLVTAVEAAGDDAAKLVALGLLTKEAREEQEAQEANANAGVT